MTKTATTTTRTLIFECVFVLVTLSGFLVQTANSQQLNLYEGSDCRSHGGAAGVCRRVSHCPQALQSLQGARRRQPVICGFIGTGARSDISIVCCETQGPTPGSRPGPHPWKTTARPVFTRDTARPVFTRDTPRPVFTRDTARPVLQKTTPRPGVHRPTPRPGVLPLKTTPRPGVLNLKTTVQPLVKTTVKPDVAVGGTMNLGNRMLVGEKARKACDDMTNEIPLAAIPLIFDGVSTAEGEFPHMALLGFRGVSGAGPLAWNCGGTLISNLYVLTAAHCLRTKNQGSPVRVRLGEYDTAEEGDHAVDFGVAEIVVHPEYKATAWYNDIGLIKLDRPAKFSEYIHPACLYTKPEEPPNGLIITGWGATTHDGGEKSTVLLKGNRTLSPVEASKCISFYRGAGARIAQGILAGMFCAGDSLGTVDTCQGDSGGPIQIAVELTPATIYMVVGVTSGGPGLCGGRTPAIYSRVFNYLSWIEGIVWK